MRRFFVGFLCFCVAGLAPAATHAQGPGGADGGSAETATEDANAPPRTPPEVVVNVPHTICEGKTITAITVSGARRVDPDDVRATMKLHRGSTCEDAAVTRDARALWDLGYFSDLLFEATARGDSLELHVTVTERPAIRHVTYKGNHHVGKDDIGKKITLREGEVLSLTKVREQVTKVRDLYAEKGYFLAQVAYKLVPVPGDNNEVDVVLTIREGKQVSVRRIAFVGNAHIPGDELRSIMQTSQTGFFSFLASNDNFKRDVFDDDVVRLSAYYYDKGYLTMNTGTPRTALTPDRRHIDITVPIDEGPRFRIGEIRVIEKDADGKEIEPLGGAKALRKEIHLDKGEWFNRSTIATGLQGITRRYRDAGYAYVDVAPQTHMHSGDHVVDVDVVIDRGHLVHIERIHIGGNTKTRELTISEGDLYSQSKIEDSKEQVTALGYFGSVDVSEERGSADDLIVLNVEVTEKPTGTFQVGAGFSSVESFILTAQIQQDNLFGRGQSLGLQLQLSGIRQLIQFSFTEPWFLGTQWSLGVSAFKTIRQFSSFNQDSTGGSITFGHPIVDRRLRLYLQYHAENVKISARTGGLFDLSSSASGFTQFEVRPIANTFRDGLTSELRLTLAWDSRNNRLFPTKGVYASYSAEVADRFLGSQNVFTRHTAFLRWYRHLWGPFVFKMNTEFGIITSRLAEGVPIFERFYLGGIYNIRGFGLNDLGPRIGVPSRLDPNAPINPYGEVVGGNVEAFYQLEVEFPIVKSIGIRGVVFTDGGNAWNLEERFCQGGRTAIPDQATDPCGIHPSIRTSWGFGFRWLSPLGPLRFEWGVPIKRRPQEKKVRFEFTIGNSF